MSWGDPHRLTETGPGHWGCRVDGHVIDAELVAGRWQVYADDAAAPLAIVATLELAESEIERWLAAS